MKVEVIVFGKPFNGKPAGTPMYLTPAQAKLLYKLGRVTYATKDAVVEVTPEAEAPRRRTYRRRDMKAE